MAKFEESRIQEGIVKRFNELVFYKQLKPCFMYSNRNEDNQNNWKAAKLGAIYNRMGRKKGIPDLSLIYGQGSIAYIEVKIPSMHRTTKGKETKSRGMSKNQIDFYENYIKPMNIKFAVCSTIEDFESFIRFLNLVRITHHEYLNKFAKND